MVVEACLTAPSTCPYAHLQEFGPCRSAREFQPFLLCQGARPELLRSGCLQLKPPQFEDHRIFRNLCSDIDQSVHLSSSVHRPVIVDVQGEELEKKAEKKLNGWGLFGSKYEDAVDFYDKAANCYKLAKNCHLLL